MKIFAAVVFAALLAGPAFAQSQSVPKYGEVDKDKTPQQIQAEKEAEKAYNRSLGNIPEQKSTDPWGNVRSDNAPKTAAKTSPTAKTSPAKPKAKTDSAAKQ